MLYSTDMVVAILEDRKTKTRRMTGLEDVNVDPDAWSLMEMGHRKTLKGDTVSAAKFESSGAIGWIDCPYGQPGDILWVRETWNYGYPKTPKQVFFKADCPYAHAVVRWQPSIFMPKACAHRWLQITDIKVERLNDISEEDAIAEGIKMHDGAPESPGTPYFYLYPHKNKRKRRCLGPIAIDDAYISKGIFGIQEPAKMSFRTLWDMVNGFDAWKANPWVWVISFNVLSTTGRPTNHKSTGKEVAHV